MDSKSREGKYDESLQQPDQDGLLGPHASMAAERRDRMNDAHSKILSQGEYSADQTMVMTSQIFKGTPHKQEASVVSPVGNEFHHGRAIGQTFKKARAADVYLQERSSSLLVAEELVTGLETSEKQPLTPWHARQAKHQEQERSNSTIR